MGALLNKLPVNKNTPQNWPLSRRHVVCCLLLVGRGGDGPSRNEQQTTATFSKLGHSVSIITSLSSNGHSSTRGDLRNADGGLFFFRFPEVLVEWRRLAIVPAGVRFHVHCFALLFGGGEGGYPGEVKIQYFPFRGRISPPGKDKKEVWCRPPSFDLENNTLFQRQNLQP